MNNRRSPRKSQSDSNDGKAVNLELQDGFYKFPIVGIGASAGGLEAFTQLLSHLPSDTGMAFVLVQHLDPNHKSMLREILSRATTMPVSEVVDNTSVEANHVYVIPPNKQMTISQGVLKLMPRQKVRGMAMTVDTFFLSLAEERGNKAIAIVLSGGDSDGALGAKAIKAAGGITFAQCQDTAQVDSMPNTAVATGHVDFILPPQAIAQELAKISHHPYVASSEVNALEEASAIEAEKALETIFQLLRASKGVDFNYYKHTTLKRRILRRMVLYQIERLEDYATFLENHPAEIHALYEDVLINVTSFMRDPEAFDTLKSKVFPVITRDKSPGIPIRIWVAGCSTGEEAYSIAICLLEFLETQTIKPPIQIYATDISESAIEKARLGIYKSSQMEEISTERLRRFFVQLDDSYQISKAVRELCVFAKHNLGADPPFSKLDLITCRNVMIYFGTTLQKKILPIFHYGLKPTGFLMLGTSETVGEFLDLFSLVDKKYKIYARKLTQVRLPLDVVSNNYALTSNFANFNPQNEETFSDFDLQKEADQIVLNRYAPVGVVTSYDLEILQFRGQTSSYLEPAPGRASLNLLKMLREELRIEVRTAIQQAKKQDLSVKKENLQIWLNEQPRQVSINVIPFKARTSEERYFLILFEDAPATPHLAETSSQKTTRTKQTTDKEIARLKEELMASKEHLQAIIEEQEASNQDLRAANEEILSSNEELQSTNEELETAKEEIQAANEELNTVNEELYRRNIESSQVSNDLQNLLSSTNIPILMLGSDLRIRRFTPLARQILNLIPTDVGRPLGDINLNLNLPDLEEQILEVINTLSVKEQEVQDQNGHWYDLRIRPYRTIDNKIDGAVVILLDIDALKRSAEQLRQSRNYAEAIVGTMREALLVLDTNFQIISANEAFYETFQVSRSEVEQRLIFDLGNKQWDIPQLRSLQEAIAAGNSQLQDFQNLEVEHEFEQIGRKVMLLNARKMPQANHEEMILLAIADITQQKDLLAERAQLLLQEQSARAAAETANLIKDEFLSVLSHELRNPLNSLVGWAQLLKQQKVDKNRLNRGLEAIEQSAKLQTQLIEDLLDISRVTSGKLRLNVYTMQLAPVIRAAIEVVRTSADAKQIQLVSSLDATSQQISGDPIRLQQVVWNLLSNAIKFTPARGRVEITLKYIDSMAQIQVSDTGKGISADFLPYVFDRFRQADGTLTRQNTGLGLGLTIVRHLVELHGGTVHAESLGEGQGATFTVRLPLQATIPELAVNSIDAIDTEVAVEDIPSLAGVRVLIVDDAADVREIFSAVLEGYQATVTTVATASEAIATLTANPSEYDVLLSDISMPGEDGYTLIRRIRQLSALSGGQIPAAALTANARSEDYAQAIAAGFQMHLTKPVPPDQLVIAVANLAGRITDTYRRSAGTSVRRWNVSTTVGTSLRRWNVCTTVGTSLRRLERLYDGWNVSTTVGTSLRRWGKTSVRRWGDRIPQSSKLAIVYIWQSDVMLMHRHVMPMQSDVMPMQSHVMPMQSHVMPMQSHVMLMHRHVMPMQSHVMLMHRHVMPMQSPVIKCIKYNCRGGVSPPFTTIQMSHTLFETSINQCDRFVIMMKQSQSLVFSLSA